MNISSNFFDSLVGPPTRFFEHQRPSNGCWIVVLTTPPAPIGAGDNQWCGLKPSVLGQDRSETKKSVLVLVVVLRVWCCVANTVLSTLVVIIILKDTATFQVLFIFSLYSVLETSLLWRSTVAFTYLKVKSTKCLCLLPVILVLLLVLLHGALASCGAVYCNRSCLCVCDSGRAGGRCQTFTQPAWAVFASLWGLFSLFWSWS